MPQKKANLLTNLMHLTLIKGNKLKETISKHILSKYND